MKKLLIICALAGSMVIVNAAKTPLKDDGKEYYQDTTGTSNRSDTSHHRGMKKNWNKKGMKKRMNRSDSTANMGDSTSTMDTTSSH